MDMLERIRNRKKNELQNVHNEVPIPIPIPSFVMDVVGQKENKKLIPKRKRQDILTESSFDRNYVVFDEWEGQEITIRDPFQVPKFNKTTKTEFTFWDTNLWIEAGPKTWDELKAFTETCSPDIGDRSKMNPNPMQVLRALENTVNEKKKKVHVLVGETVGKSSMLRLLAAHYKYELISVQEDDVIQFLKDSSAVGLDTTPRLWVLEHLDMYEFDKVMKVVPLLFKSGLVFATSWPDAPFLLDKNILISHVYPWDKPSNLKFLQMYAPIKEWDIKESENISHSLCMGQFFPSGKTRIPTNLRFLVEDTLCDRSSEQKCSHLSGDIETSIALLQEMIPLTTNFGSIVRALEACSFLDLCEYYTHVKEAFIDGTIQNTIKIRHMDSGVTIPVPQMYWKNNRKQPIDYKKFRFQGEHEEYSLGDPETDLRDLSEDAALFAQARGCKDTWKKRCF